MAQRTERPSLRDLSPATRLVIAAFLIAVGIGYFSALVQLHYQHASPPNLLPTAADAMKTYAPNNGGSQMERLLTASEDKAFNGHGTMVPAFTTESTGWLAFVKEHGEPEARRLREAERLILLDWIKSGCDRKAYDEDSYKPPGNFPADRELPEDYLVTGPAMSTLERLLTTPSEGHPFNITGSMRAALFEKSSGYKGLLNKRAADRDVLLKEREGECQALIAWARAHAPKTAYDNDDFSLPPDQADQTITEKYLVTDNDGNVVKPHRVKIQELIQDRCVRCHSEGNRNGALDEYELISAYAEPEENGKGGQPISPNEVKIRSLINDRCVRCHQDSYGADDRARKAPLDSYEHFTAYCGPETAGGMSLRALAQTTHAHLLSFAVLFSLTGLVFSFTSYPLWMRVLIAPLALVAQVAEIGCWWLSRVYPEAAMGIVIGGGIVGAALGIQIVFSLLNMVFGRKSNGNGNGA